MFMFALALGVVLTAYYLEVTKLSCVNCPVFRWWAEEPLVLFAKPNGKAKMLQSRQLRVNQKGKLLLLR